MWRHSFPWDALGTRRRPQPAARGRELDADRRRQRPGVEALEGRQLLAAVTDFTLSSNQSAAAALTAGPDGNLWFPEQEGAGQIARITTAGAITAFPLPGGYSNPSALTVGPDNNLWFTDLFDDGGTSVPSMAQITPSGTITEYQGHSDYTTTSAPTLGPDHNLWFTESTPSSNGVPTASVVRVTTAGVVSEFLLSSPDNVVSGLTDGPDDNLWFAASTSNNPMASSSIGRITPGGVITNFALPANYVDASALTTGPDGNLWFPNVVNSGASSAGRAIGQITPTGLVTEFLIPPSLSIIALSTLTVGPGNDSLWFTAVTYAVPTDPNDFLFFKVQIGQVTTSGSIATSQVVTPAIEQEPTVSAPTVGPDQNLYFTIGINFSADFVGGLQERVSVARVNPSGGVVEFAGTSNPIGALNTLAASPAVGADGNLWFPDGMSIDRLDLSQASLSQAIGPGVYQALEFPEKPQFSTVVLNFDEALVPSSANTRSLYSVAVGVKKRHMLIYSKAIKIRSVSYDPSTQTVTIRLAKSVGQFTSLQFTVRPGLMATNGTATTSDLSGTSQEYYTAR
jgi:virginiamycin B lyase